MYVFRLQRLNILRSLIFKGTYFFPSELVHMGAAESIQGQKTPNPGAEDGGREAVVSCHGSAPFKSQ